MDPKLKQDLLDFLDKRLDMMRIEDDVMPVFETNCTEEEKSDLQAARKREFAHVEGMIKGLEEA